MGDSYECYLAHVVEYIVPHERDNSDNPECFLKQKYNAEQRCPWYMAVVELNAI